MSVAQLPDSSLLRLSQFSCCAPQLLQPDMIPRWRTFFSHSLASLLRSSGLSGGRPRVCDEVAPLSCGINQHRCNSTNLLAIL